MARLNRIQSQLIIGLAVLVFVFFYRYFKERQREKQTQTTISTDQQEPPALGKQQPDPHTTSTATGGYAFDLPFGGKGQQVDNGCYVVSYVEAFEQPEWTEYVLDGTPMLKIKRENDRFVENPAITTGSAVPADYRNSGYDRGHLVPAADMKTSLDCFQKSFLLSNISPQEHGFNTGLWRRLEESVRKWARSKTPLQIISGPILKKGLPKSIGTVNSIPVPEEYYKVIVHHGSKGPVAVGFIMPNHDSELSVERFAVSVGQVERRTGFDFNRSLPDSLEKAIENNFDLKYWFN